MDNKEKSPTEGQGSESWQLDGDLSPIDQPFMPCQAEEADVPVESLPLDSSDEYVPSSLAVEPSNHHRHLLGVDGQQVCSFEPLPSSAVSEPLPIDKSNTNFSMENQTLDSNTKPNTTLGLGTTISSTSPKQSVPPRPRVGINVISHKDPKLFSFMPTPKNVPSPQTHMNHNQHLDLGPFPILNNMVYPNPMPTSTPQFFLHDMSRQLINPYMSQHSSFSWPQTQALLSSPHYLHISNPTSPNYQYALERRLDLPHPKPNTYLEQLSQQIRDVDRRVYKCSTCGMEFPNAQAFGGHMSSHSKARKAEAAKASKTILGIKIRDGDGVEPESGIKKARVEEDGVIEKFEEQNVEEVSEEAREKNLSVGGTSNDNAKPTPPAEEIPTEKKEYASDESVTSELRNNHEEEEEEEEEEEGSCNKEAMSGGRNPSPSSACRFYS